MIAFRNSQISDRIELRLVYFSDDEADDPGAGPSRAPDFFPAPPAAPDTSAGPYSAEESAAGPSTQSPNEEGQGSDEDTASNEEDVTGYPTYQAVEDDAISGEAV